MNYLWDICIYRNDCRYRVTIGVDSFKEMQRKFYRYSKGIEIRNLFNNDAKGRNYGTAR